MRKLNRSMRIRMLAFLLGTVIAFASVTSIKLTKIMLIDGSKYQTLASEQQLYDTLVTAPRGKIYDANMNILATSDTAYTIYIIPNSIGSIQDKNKQKLVKTAIASGLSEILSMEYETVFGYTEKSTSYVTVKKRVEKGIADKVREYISENEDLELAKYIGIDETTKRYYPNDSLATVLLGFVGDDNQGLSGLERYYDTTLTGTVGRVVAAKNALGADMPFSYQVVEEAKEGNSLVLTVDSYVQYAAEKYLAEALEINKVSNKGTCIVMNVKTGAILGMAVKGDFDPNEPFTLSASDQKLLEDENPKFTRNELLNLQWRNKAISDTYAPGSVFKVFTAAVGIEENLINKNSTFNCTHSINIAGQNYNCHKAGGHGVQNLQQAISNSCNPAFITIGQIIGTATFSKYFKAFGFTEKTGIDLPGEASSNYHKEENMGPTELASSSFGQTFNVTPMQMISAISAAVNGGYLVQPHLVSRVLDENGKVTETKSTAYKRQVISESTSATMRELMEYVCQNGAKNALVPGYRVGAKTGTSQKVSKINATGDHYLYIGSCVTVAPIDNPEIAVLVMLDEPKGDKYYGGIISAPVNSKIMADVLPYLGYEPQYTEEELKSVARSVPSFIGSEISEAKSQINTLNLTYKIVGSGNTVVRQLPEAGSSIYSGGVVILYTEESGNQTVTVPNLTGLTATEANTAAASAGINIEFSGNTSTAGIKSYKQSIEAGQQVAAGTIVTVYFRDETSVDTSVDA